MKSWAWVAVAVFAVAAVLVADDSEDSGGSDDSAGGMFDNPEIEAQIMCEEFVDRELRAPSTAEYMHGETFLNPSGQWVVRGEVDAENAFGAMIRGGFVCRMTDEGDTWLLVNDRALRG